MKYLLSVLTLLLAPAVTFAVGAGEPPALGGFNSIATGFSGIINILVPVMISLAFIYFAWGVIKYVLAKDPEKQKEARGTIVWGVISITVIVGVWGISNFLLEQFDIDTEVNNINVPRVQLNP